MSNETPDFHHFLENCGQAMEEFQKLNLDAAQKMSQLQLEFMNLWMECNCTQIQRLAKAENPSDVVATESGITTEYMQKFAANAQQTFDALTDIQHQMYCWMQDNSMLLPFNNNGTKAASSKKSNSKPAAARQ